MIEKLFYQSLIGVSFSMYLWLTAMGLTIIYGVLRVLNFAHGALYMLAAYLTFTFYFMWGLDFWLSLFLSAITSAVIGMVLERYLLRRFYAIETPFQLLVTYSIILILDDLVKFIWGPQYHLAPTPAVLQGSIKIFGMDYPYYSLFMIGLGLAVAVGFSLMIGKTWWGRTIRATVSQREMAECLGIDTAKVYLTLFALACAINALGGGASIVVRTVNPGLGDEIIIMAFIVTVIGGLGSVKGAFVGALLVGMLWAFGIMLWPEIDVYVPYLLMMVTLLIRPQGIFGGKA